MTILGLPRSSVNHHLHARAAWRNVLRRDVSLAAVYMLFRGRAKNILRLHAINLATPPSRGALSHNLSRLLNGKGRFLLFYSYFLQSFNAVGLKWCKAFANKGRWSVYVVQSTIGMWCDTYPATPTFKAGYSLPHLGTSAEKVIKFKWKIIWTGRLPHLSEITLTLTLNF